jgi:hypothetical protein
VDEFVAVQQKSCAIAESNGFCNLLQRIPNFGGPAVWLPDHRPKECDAAQRARIDKLAPESYQTCSGSVSLQAPRIRNDGRNPRSTAQPSTLARAATGSSADTARRRPSLNPRAIITGIIFLAIGYRYAPSLSWSRAKPRAPASTSLRASLAGWRKSPSLAARTLPRALSRSSSIILGWSPSVIAAKGEYAGWRATPATGDFDLHTFAVRAYPVDRSTGCGRDERLY